MAQANIIGTMKDISGLYVKNATLIFTLLNAGAAAEGLVVPSIPITAYTDDVGYFSVAVFANGTDSGFPKYKVELVEGSKITNTFNIFVPALRTEYNLSELVQFEQSIRNMPASPAYLDLVDSRVGAVANGTVSILTAPRGVTYASGKAFVTASQTTALTLTVNVNGVSKGTITIAANATSGSLNAAVKVNPDELITVVLSGSNGAQNLTYYLKGTPT